MYAYTQKGNSSRQIVKELREHMNLMWTVATTGRIFGRSTGFVAV
jgi:transposase